MSELYKAIAGSPITYLAGDISAAQTTIAVADDSALPDAPNICTIGYGENIETIRYGAKSNGVLQNVTRGIEGTPRAWPAGTEVARFFTAYDLNSIIENFNSHLAESAYWKRVDTLSAPVEITSTDYTNPTIVPLSEPYGTGSASKGIVYAVELASSYDFRSSQLVFFTYSTGGSAGGLMINGVEGIIRVNRIKVSGNSNAIGFYAATEKMYVRAVYKVKEVEL